MNDPTKSETQPSTSIADSQTFRLEEFRALRKEIELYLTESRSQERYTLIAVGAISAWLISNHIADLRMWMVPFILTVATTVRMIGILIHFKNLACYIFILEEKFKVGGWEHHAKRPSLGAAYAVLNVTLLILTVIAAYLHDDLGKLIPLK